MSRNDFNPLQHDMSVDAWEWVHTDGQNIALVGYNSKGEKVARRTFEMKDTDVRVKTGDETGEWIPCVNDDGEWSTTHEFQPDRTHKEYPLTAEINSYKKSYDILCEGGYSCDDAAKEMMDDLDGESRILAARAILDVVPRKKRPGIKMRKVLAAAACDTEVPAKIRNGIFSAYVPAEEMKEGSIVRVGYNSYRSKDYISKEGEVVRVSHHVKSESSINLQVRLYDRDLFVNGLGDVYSRKHDGKRNKRYHVGELVGMSLIEEGDC